MMKQNMTIVIVIAIVLLVVIWTAIGKSCSSKFKMLAGPSQFGIYVDRDWSKPVELVNGGTLSKSWTMAGAKAGRSVGRQCEVFVYPASRVVFGNMGILEIYGMDHYRQSADFMGVEPARDGEMARFVVTFSSAGQYGVLVPDTGWALLKVE